jgi:cobalt-precorrin-7 (C5)-methyltransferase
MADFSIVGIGPGHRDYMIPISLKAVENAELLIGGERHLKLFSDMGKREMILKGNYNEVFDYISNNLGKERISVLVSGDPGYHSLLGLISKRFPRESYSVFPGLSSFQVAMTKVGEIWNDAKLISLHGKELDQVLTESDEKLVLLTDYKNTPYRIARFLLENNTDFSEAIIAENLTYSDEKIRNMKLEEIEEEEEYQLCVMIIQ